MPISNGNVRILQNLCGHTSDVTSCDFALNFTLVTGSSDKTIRVWDWIPGSGYIQRANSPWRGHKYQVTCVRISPQGSMLASASVDGTAVLWNLHSGQKLYTMTQVNGDAMRVCRFAPDSSILVTAGDNGAICIWDLIHRSLIRTLMEHEGTTQSLAFTPDSQYLVSACSLELIKVWYIPDLVDTTVDSPCIPVARVDNAHDLGVFCIDISPNIQTNEDNPLVKNYTMASSGNNNEIKIWTISSMSTPKYKSESNTVTIELVDMYDGHGSSVTCIRYTRNGAYLLSCSVDKLAKIWDTNGNCIATLVGHSRYVNCITASKDCTIAATGSTGSNDKMVLIWDLSGEITLDSELFQHRLSAGDTSHIRELQLMQNVDNENDIKLLEKIDDISDGAINCCCFNSNGVLATASGDKLVRVFRVSEDNNNIEEMCWSPLEGHTYAVNFVEFSTDAKLLASCSQDGSTIVWDAMNGDKVASIPNSSFSVRVCKFSPDCRLIVTGGDDEKAIVWDVETMNEEAMLEGHLDAITSAAFTPDSRVIVTTCFNSHFRLWAVEDYRNIFIKEDVHDNGIQCCDFSPNLDPIPSPLFDTQTYLLATCGNDGFGKVWRITVPKKDSELNLDEIAIKLWRTLHGHGGSVICVRFSPTVGEILCSTATDRQARLWSVYSGECLFVVDHDSIVTACTFSMDCSLLVTGCLDKTLWLWKLPQQLVFQSAVANKIKCRRKELIDWTTQDIVKWLTDIQLKDVIENVQNTSLDGQKILTLTEHEICVAMDLSDKQTEKLSKELKWLKQDQLNIISSNTIDIPHEFLCPITHELMREPVTCSDGFTYEKKAISEWFMSGKYSSPMTNEKLESTDYIYNQELRNTIHTFLDHSVESEE